MFSPSKLKHYRLANNLSQTAIANKLDVTRATLSAWETGKTVPNKKTPSRTSSTPTHSPR